MKYFLLILNLFEYSLQNLQVSLRSLAIVQEANSGELIKHRNLSDCNNNCICNGSGAFPKCSYCKPGYIFYPTNNDCKTTNVCTGSGFVLDQSNGQMCCIFCCQKCNWQNSDGSQSCTECISGYELIGKQCYENCRPGTYRFNTQCKRCQKCPNDQYLKSSNQFCSTCDYQCIPCNSIPFTFSIFQMDSSLITNQDYCLVCSCKQCQNGYIKFNDQQCIASCDQVGSNYEYVSSTNSCQCQPGYKYLTQNPFKNTLDCTQGQGQGYYCNNQNKCFKCSQNCNECSDSLTCQKCNKGFYVWENNCNSSCFPDLNIVPNENSGVCECPQGYILRQLQTPLQNQQKVCQLDLILQEIHIYNKLMQSKRCQKCPNDQYLKSSNQFCSTCDYQCIPCNSIPFTFSIFQMDSSLITNQDYCLVCSCKQCQNGYIKFNDQQCIASCDQVGSNYEYVSSTNSCQCQPGYKYITQNPFKNTLDCTQGQGQGYYCNNQNKCFKCSQNCNECSDSLTCQKCNKGFYVWENNCNSSCFPDLNIVPNENSGSNDQPLPSSFYDNLIVFQYNRELTKEEYQSFQFYIDHDILNLGSDYQIINTKQQKQNIQCTVGSAKNRKIKQLRIQVSKSIQNYQVLNAILVSKEYAEQSSDSLPSKQISQSFQSMSQTFTQDQNSVGGKIISFLKQFQVLCYISNFVQVLPLIYLIRDELADNVKFSSLFGVSLIFNKTPPPSQISMSSLETSTNSYSEKLKNSLQQFGISSNFYENFLQVHLLITVSIKESFCFKKYQIFMVILNLR
ncbi:hypothetical protein ABPG72_015891 [Tetrahymena utriculariae]